MISLERRFIFVHIPKTAGTSLESRLVDDSCVFLSHQWDREVCKHAPLNHLTLAEIDQSGILSKAELRDFFIFTVVRNPWDRCISELFCPWVGWRFGSGSVKQRLGALLTSAEYFDNHGRPQSEFIRGESRRVDFIAKFETLTNDWETIRAALGVDEELPRLNVGVHRPYWEYFDQEMVDMVAERYAQDIEAFAYEFTERRSSGQMPGLSGRSEQGSKA